MKYIKDLMLKKTQIGNTHSIERDKNVNELGKSNSTAILIENIGMQQVEL
jgi:hypothetical protein